MSKLLIALLGAGAISGSAVCDLCRSPAGAPALSLAPIPVVQVVSRAPAAEPRVVTLHVEGMTCGGCTIATRKVLERLAGVRKADVSYERREAVVTYDPATVTVGEMIGAIGTLRYTATVVAK